MYLPQSQIKTGLKTQGNEFFTLDGRSYIGDYFETSNGRYYSGKSPNDINVFEIYSNNPNTLSPSPIESETSGGVQDIIDIPYYNSRQITSLSSTSTKFPISFLPSPTPEDYEFGEIERYFLKKRNEVKYKEINQEEWEKYVDNNPNVPFQLFLPFSISWEISGDKDKVFNTNKNTVERAIQRFKLLGFKSYLKERYTQFYK